MKYHFLTIALLFCAVVFSQNKGTVSGIITDKDVNNEPMPFASVSVKGTTLGASTDMEGKYSLALDTGDYILSISFVGYETAEIPFTIKANQTVTINKAIGSGSVKLEDIILTGNVNRQKETAILLDQKKAVEIKQSIGAQELSRKGVSDVEEGLTKITGITKVGSRGLFVRGLEDRYNNLLVNDLAVPSNNPFKKIVPLDLFPTDIVDVIEVYKTFNPNIYGDFAGGTFDILTSKGTKSITKLTLGVGYVSNSSLKDFVLSKDASSSKGFFGMNGNDRELPGIFGSIPSGKTLSGQESISSFGSGFDAGSKKSPLNTSIGVLHSEKFSFGKESKLSYIVSIDAENDFAIRKGVDRTVSPVFIYNNNFESTDYIYKTSLSSLAAVNYKDSRLDLTLNTLYLRTTESLIKDQFGIQGNQVNTPNYLLRTNQFDQSDYLNAQLFGDYAITEDKKHTVKAGISLAKTAYQQPDRKFFGGSKQENGQIITSYGGNNFIRQYLDIDGDTYYSGLGEYSLNFGDKEKKSKLTIGYNGNTSKTESSYRFISTFYKDGPGNFTVDLDKIDTQLQNDLASENFGNRESSNAQYQVKLKESAHAGYADLLYQITDKLEINAGIRFENTERTTIYRLQGSFNDPFVTKKYNNQYILPSMNMKYEVNEKANIRLAAGKTYTKPVIMEAFPIEYINADGTALKGNQFLTNSDNYNLDLKYELFPSSKEMFAVGVFGKKIDQPIERTFEANAANGLITTFRNSDRAFLYGAEFEFLFDMGRLSDNLKSFSFGFNTSLMQTRAEVKPFYIDDDGTLNGTLKQSIETHKKRDLQGASKWLVNSDLKYQFNFSETWSNTVSLVYAVFGKRIYSVGTAGLDHIYELPVQQLDLVWGSKLSEHIDIKLSADNILNPTRKLELGENNAQEFQEESRLLNSYKKGVGISFSVGYTF